MDSWRGSTVRDVGRIYETRGGPDDLRWFWSMTVNGPMTRSDRVATLEEAKAQFQKSWDAWKAWASLEETELRRLEQRGAVAFAIVIFIALVIAVWGLF